MSTLTAFEGDASVKITLDDTAAGIGNIQVDVEVIPNPNIGDLRGVFFHIADESLLPGLSAAGPDITQQVFGPANSVIDLGGGNNLNGPGSPCGCDIGLEIGTAGIGMDDIQSTSFTLTHDMVALDLSQFTMQAVGARVASVGLPMGSRTDSAKLAGTFPVPEPSGLAMMTLGLLGCLRSRRK